MNIAEEIFRNANSDALAVVDRGVSHTYGILNAVSARVAEELRQKHNLDSPARIGLRCRDGFHYVALSLGILRANACFVPIAPEASASEQNALVKSLHLHGIMTGSEEPGHFTFETIRVERELPWQKEFEELNPALIRFSSGTTGDSKGVLLSHETICARVAAANAGLQIGASDRVLWVLGMSHHFAVSILLYLWNGAAIIIPETHLAEDLLAAANTHGATVLYASPFHYILLTAGNEKIHWPSLRFAVSTTAPLPEDVARRFADACGIYPAQALGIIEVGLPFLNHFEPEKRHDSIGRPQPSFEIRLLSNDGQPTEPGTPGHLLIKGLGLFDAYIDPWKSRTAALRDGEWFSSGDLASIDGDGYYYIQGRSKTVINIGGMKFFPEEVENLLCSHPSVTEARVSCRQHAHFGSISIAEVVASNVTSAELLGHCRRNLARYKIPAEIVFVDSIPKTPSGKILRR
jgi:long-chain acyl-CoA synthetase